MKIHTIATVLMAAVLVQGVNRTSAASLNHRPIEKELSVVDWSAIRAEYQSHRHAAFADPSGYHARNFKQQWLTHFDRRGFTVQPDSGEWTWGLELKRYGFEGHELSAERARVTTDLDRVSYQRASLEEWFVNDQRGLEHGFTLRERPVGEGGALRLELSIRGGLRPRIAADGSAITFLDAAGQPRLNYTGLKAWDADGKLLTARFEASAAGIVVAIEEAHARYPLTIDPIAQQAYLKASNTGGGDEFGTLVAVSGDTVVVGATGESSNATGVNGNQSDNSASLSGAAYVFVRSGGVWTQQAYLKASNTGTGDRFGHSVAVSGDTVVVGAILEQSNATGVNGNQADNSISQAGAAYVFVRSGGVWTQQAYLKASNTGALDEFGWSVAVSGDTMVVGARQEASNATGVNGNQSDNSATNAGAAYVFVRSGSTWSQQAYLKASNAEAHDQFGSSVAVSGDTVVVGAPLESSIATGVNGDQSDNSASGAGAAYVFVRSFGVWSQQAYLKASNPGTIDFFGWSVAVWGDTVVVGALQESSNATGVNGNQGDNSASDSGAAYVFVRSGSTWSQQAYLKASNTKSLAFFGYSVAVSGDTVVVGAPNESSNATGVNGNQSDTSAFLAGAAYLFVRSGAVWTQQAFLKASNTEASDQFGSSVAVSGDTVVVGALQESSNATGVNGNQTDNSAFLAGAAYVFQPTVHVTVTRSPDVAALNGAVTADGTPIDPSQSFDWFVGSDHTLSAIQSKLNASQDTLYLWNGWSDVKASTHTVTAPSLPITYAVSYVPAYRLTTAVSPPGTGEVFAGDEGFGAFLLSDDPVDIQAAPNPGYQFDHWTGPVINPTTALSGVRLTGPATVTAFFIPIPPPVTPQFTIAASVPALNRATNRYRQTVTLTNHGAALASAAFVTDGLPSGVAIYLPDGFTSATSPAGSPYKELGPISAGATVNLSIEFSRTGTPAITYTARVLGPGSR